MSDPGTCPACKGPMKPLFTGFFCPKDCDRPHLEMAALDKAQDLMAKPRLWTMPPANIWGLAPPWAPGYSPADDQCRDAMCRASGTMTHTSIQQMPGNLPAQNYSHFACTVCAKTWNVKYDPSHHKTRGRGTP